MKTTGPRLCEPQQLSFPMKPHIARMTIEELVNASGIKDTPGFETFDYAVPMNRDGTYPHDGRCISVYRKGLFPELVTYDQLHDMIVAREENIEPATP